MDEDLKCKCVTGAVIAGIIALMIFGIVDLCGRRDAAISESKAKAVQSLAASGIPPDNIEKILKVTWSEK